MLSREELSGRVGVLLFADSQEALSYLLDAVASVGADRLPGDGRSRDETKVSPTARATAAGTSAASARDLPQTKFSKFSGGGLFSPYQNLSCFKQRWTLRQSP